MSGLRLAAALAVAAGVVTVVPAGAGPTCSVTTQTRNTWAQVSAPGAVVAMEDVDPCKVISVRDDRSVSVSPDGGRTWQQTGTAPAVPGMLVTSGLGVDTVALLPASGTGLWTSRDWGQTWRGTSGLSGPVQRLVADARDRTLLYAISAAGLPPALPRPPVPLPVAPGNSLYVSTDAGVSFSAVEGATGLAPSDVATDPANPGWVWLSVAGPAGGLYLSNDGGATFLNKATGDVRSLATSRLAGGGSEVVGATAKGFLLSRDGGTSVVTHDSAPGVTALALEWNHPSALMALTDAGVRRSSDTGLTVRDQGAGLTPSCAATQLRRDRSIPSVFLLTCNDGSTWRYRSDGTDLSATDNPDSSISNPTTPLVFVTPTPMKLLRRLRIRRPGDGRDGSIAFDGTDLYFTDGGQTGVIHRQTAKDGATLPDLQTTVPRGIQNVAYDSNNHHLIVRDRSFMLWDVALPSGRAARLFQSPTSSGPFSYDSATDRLLFAEDGSGGWQEYDRQGVSQFNCAGALGGIYVGISGGAPTIAGLVATGDGQVYVETEDDATVLRMDRSCHVLAAFDHASFSEAGAENDAVACDTTTFPTPAIWMRDAAAAYFYAYEVPGGYCALPSTVAVTAPPSVATGSSGPVCATLRLRATGRLLAGLPVDLLVAGRGIGSPLTDQRGVACQQYSPIPGEAGSQQPGRTTSSRTQPVLAAFLGTPAYRAANAQVSTVVTADYQLPPPVPPRIPPAPLVPPAAHLL
nr:hypothetical protein [Actinomycetota bacterium]